MANPVETDVVTFTPYSGGLGVRLSVTATASALVGIPGATGGGSSDSKASRVRIANTGNVSAWVRFNGPANLSSMAILPGTVEMFGAPFSAPGGVSISAITESGTSTTLSVVAGDGV